MAEQDPQFDLPTGDEPAVESRLQEDATERSLSDDLFDLLDDGKTYAEAELQFQKTRATFALDMGRKGAGFALAALLILHLAVVTLAIGSVFALAPLLTPWGATAVVVCVLVVAAVVFGLLAKRYFARLGKAFGDER
ncbi:phage holin family protein [Tsuneonella mangrovi]|uniref:phage holin family protein n=1 Tax=Tsuneonella mangrovi TaxID=1982042 RepID=UPI0014725BE2|nr:phage holin family protein [Tsuneonella mangrovi]